MTNEQKYALALGMFDGMHLGHQKVIAQTVSTARERGLKSLVYTFENHPKSVFSASPAPIMDASARRTRMLKMGVDEVVMARFDANTASESPETFIRALMARYPFSVIVAGSDYTFGSGAKGTVDTLRAFAPMYGFSVIEVPIENMDVSGDGHMEKISSTRIRQALTQGDRALAERMLGRALTGGETEKNA